MPNGKGNVTPVKNGIQLQKKLSKRRKVAWKSESASRAKPKAFKINEIDSTQEVRMDTTDSELNRVLGGGIVPGSLILLGGEPGIGKARCYFKFH
jgi:DNA repair protein RadA/Sms